VYLEQVVRYINARLAPLGEPELTGSMVSNYVKQKLVPAPQKKLYTAEHLARLLFIAVVKPVVPLEGLRLMFSIQEECYPLQTAYDYFCDEFENMLGAAFGVAPAVEGLGETESDAKDLLRSTISATVNKVCLDRYLEEYRKRREQAETLNFFCHFISEWSPVALQLVAARQHFYYNREFSFFPGLAGDIPYVSLP